MSLTGRKARPLTRDTASLRDDRLFIVACDDTYAPKQYFDYFRLTRVHIHVVPTTDGTSAAEHVLNRLLQFDVEEDDERWLLLDTDHCIGRNHVGKFAAELQRAQRSGIRVALSRPCFELWLLLHHADPAAVRHLGDAAAVEKQLRDSIGEYNKTKLKKEHYPLSGLATACDRAMQLDSDTRDELIPTHNSTRIYLLWKAIVSKALPAQLPSELQRVKAM